jgi:hypothetical protein
MQCYSRLSVGNFNLFLISKKLESFFRNIFCLLALLFQNIHFHLSLWFPGFIMCQGSCNHLNSILYTFITGSCKVNQLNYSLRSWSATSFLTDLTNFEN